MEIYQLAPLDDNEPPDYNCWCACWFANAVG